MLLVTGPVDISFKEIINVLVWTTDGDSRAGVIVLQTRLPVAISSACCGAMLSVAGLMMQTMFHNPLAGPSVLGISSGASFGVALLMLGAGGLIGELWGSWMPLVSVIAALTTSLITIMILYSFSSILRSGLTLLIVGLMLSYLFSSGISLLNYFSKADEIRSFVVWGLGSFSGMRLDSSLWLLIASVVVLIPTILCCKPLNAMLLGERYMESVGYDIKRIRGWILILTGVLVAVPTAFCGPIGFIGLIVPHLCRLLLKSSNHLVLLPASILCGATVTMGCALLGNLQAGNLGVLPINVITPLIGVPVILYLLLRRHKLFYFS